MDPSPIDHVHMESLAELCRICGYVLTDYSYDVNRFPGELKDVFVLDIFKDIDGVHPPRFCLKCYAIMTNSVGRKGNTSVTPTVWLPHISGSCSTCTSRRIKAKGGRPKKRKKTGGGRPRSIPNVQDILKLDFSKPIPANIEKAVSHVIAIKLKQSEMPNNTINFATAGSSPLTLTPITVPRKESNDASNRTLRNRTKSSKEIISLLLITVTE